MVLKFSPIEKIHKFCPSDQALLGVDFGLQRIGLAIANPGFDFATALQTLNRVNMATDIAAIDQIISDYNIAGIVFGWPLMPDGDQGAMCDRVRSFADELKNNPQIAAKITWMAYIDERLSTKTVDEFLVKSVDMSRTKRKRVVDKLAAQRILQSAIDYLERMQR